MKICIVDKLGLPYNGNTIKTRGLGGSESAIIYMSEELVRLGFDVVVFRNGPVAVVNDVVYENFDRFEHHRDCDIFLSSRSCLPFIDEAYKNTARLKILWAHDTFIEGDHLLEELCLNGTITEIFTLSDFHTNYLTNCDHGKKRNFEVLKRYIFQTRNGVRRYKDFVDIQKKNPYLCVFNASVTKGLEPLLEVWDDFVELRSEPWELQIIGGFYNFADRVPDAQELRWRELKEKYEGNQSVYFTGVIPQEHISNILTRATYMIYPTDFPETFGISTLEAIEHNVVPITCNFGALEETAFDECSFKKNYTCTPNALFPDIDRFGELRVFGSLVRSAINDRYLTQQKAYACNSAKPWITWDTIALQWKQEFYSLLGEFLPKEEYRRVQKINDAVHRIFGRRFMNQIEAVQERERRPQHHIHVITCAYNCAQWLPKNIASVRTQDYDNYSHKIIDDASTDKDVLKILVDPDLQVHFNDVNHGAVENIYHEVGRRYGEEIIVLLDGDDWLINNNSIFQHINNLVHEGYDFGYGSCLSLADNIPLIAQPYPPDVIAEKTFRKHTFTWGIPYTHLRWFKAHLLHQCDESQFKDDDGNWFRAGGDCAIFYAAIEHAKKIHVEPNVLMCYNDQHAGNDWKTDGEKQNRTRDFIRNREAFK